MRNQLEIFPQYKSHTENTWDGPCSKVSTPVGSIRTPPYIFRGHERPAEATLTSNGDVSTYVIQARIQTFFRRGWGVRRKILKEKCLLFYTLFYYSLLFLKFERVCCNPRNPTPNSLDPPMWYVLYVKRNTIYKKYTKILTICSDLP